MRRKTRKRRNKIIVVVTFGLLLFLCIGYAAFSTNLSFSAKGNIKEKSRVIQSFLQLSTEDFHNSFYRENIVSITFLDNAQVPSDATESWNVSEDKTHGGVMAWVISNNDDNTKYDLYIRAKDGVIANTDSRYLFYGFTNVRSINFKDNFDTKSVTNMSYMFANCRELLSLDLSSFDTRNVTNMANMFVSGVAVNPMKIETIIFGENFKTNNVTNMYAMFGNCNSLVNLDVSGFDTSNVTDMHDMFSSCHSLADIDVSGFNTSKVTDMHGMFFACKSLTNLDLCSFDTRSVTDMGVMFEYNSKLAQIKVGSNWVTDGAIITNMFNGCLATSVTKGMC